MIHGTSEEFLNGVPRPVAPEGEGDVGPVAPHRNADAQDRRGEDHPRQSPAAPTRCTAASTRPPRRRRTGRSSRRTRRKASAGGSTIHGFCRRSLRPFPSAGTKPACCTIGASGNFSAQGHERRGPDRRSPSLSPTIIERRKSWQKATTVITGASNDRDPRHKGEADEAGEDDPQEERALLPRPERREQVVPRQRRRRVLVDVGVLELVGEEEGTSGSPRRPPTDVSMTPHEARPIRFQSALPTFSRAARRKATPESPHAMKAMRVRRWPMVPSICVPVV